MNHFWQLVRCWPMATNHTTALEALKRAGTPPQQALEIALDAKRGCKFALHWVKLAEGRTNHDN
jgi:hypothetical protein